MAPVPGHDGSLKRERGEKCGTVNDGCGGCGGMQARLHAGGAHLQIVNDTKPTKSSRLCAHTYQQA
jgi:hypothetical protein